MIIVGYSIRFKWVNFPSSTERADIFVLLASSAKATTRRSMETFHIYKDDISRRMKIDLLWPVFSPAHEIKVLIAHA